jgi:hypothetical protein
MKHAQKILVLPILFGLIACAEPDHVEPQVSNNNTVSVASAKDQSILTEKYTRAVLGCQLDVKSKVVIAGKEKLESQSVSNTYDLLTGLPDNRMIKLDMNLAGAQSALTILVNDLSLQTVNYPGPTDAFTGVRSPVIDAKITGKIFQPAFDTNNESSHDESRKVRFYENVNMTIIEMREGLETDPTLSARLVCRLETALKTQYNNEYQRK